jgi:hypothetical protein
MEHEWILDVIADLRTFARQNELVDLASHMDTAWLLASAEIASSSKDIGAHEHSVATALGDHTSVR